MSSATQALDTGGVRNLSRPRTGVALLILTEASLFSIFIAAYIFYIGKSTVGPFPKSEDAFSRRK